MQNLHLVGFTAELDGLIFSAKRGSKSGGFVVSLDDRLLDSIREAVRLQTGAELDLEPGGAEPGAEPVAVPELRRLGRVHSALSPKEIQARLRAGRTVLEVADEAEVDESWILRFAAPVLAEQSQVVERAIQVRCRANRKGESAESLARSVAENLIDRGAILTEDEISSGWSAYHMRDDEWVVRFRYVSRRRTQVAQWAFDAAEATLVPLNRLATDLGYVEPNRRRRRPPIVDAPPLEERRMAAEASVERSPTPTRRRQSTSGPGRRRPTARRPSGTARKAVAKAGGVKTTGAAKTTGATKKARSTKSAAANKSAAKKASRVKTTAAVKTTRAKKTAGVAKRVSAKKIGATRATGARKGAAAKKTAAPKKVTRATKAAVAQKTRTVKTPRRRRPSVLAAAPVPPAPERRARPLVAVRAPRPAQPLRDRVVRAPIGSRNGQPETVVSSSNGDSSAAVVVQADRAGEAAPPAS